MLPSTHMNDAKFKMAKARSELVYLQPFFGTLALRLELVPTEKVDVMAVDGQHLFYNPKTVENMSQAMVIGVVAHEVLHCAFQHTFRRRHRRKEKWNEACDYVINAIILQEKFSLTKSRLFNSKYTNMSAEEVYERLPNRPPSNNGNDWDFGSIADPALPNPETGKTTSASAVQENSKSWEIAVKQAALIAKQQGHLPGNLGSFIDELFEAQIPWRNQLWRFLTQRKPGRITWNRPNRRLIDQGIYLPSRKMVPTGELVIVNDTSGSVSEDEFMLYASEVTEIHRTIQPTKTYILDVDTKIQSVKEYGPYDRLKFEYRGRGGTMFEPAFAWVKQKGIRPDALIYLTDGYATFPPPIHDYPVCWVITNTDITPPWGEHLILKER